MICCPRVNPEGNKCYKELIGKLNYQNTQCVKLFISKGLSIGVVAGAGNVIIGFLKGFRHDKMIHLVFFACMHA